MSERDWADEMAEVIIAAVLDDVVTTLKSGRHRFDVSQYFIAAKLRRIAEREHSHGN